MLSFLQKLFIDGIDVGNLNIKLIHLITLLILLLSIIFFSLLYHKNNSLEINHHFKIMAIVFLGFYITRRIISVCLGNNFFYAFYPFYLCNLNVILVFIYIIFDIKIGKDFVIVTGLIGGVITFLIPTEVFAGQYFSFALLDSITSHYLLVVYSSVLLLTKAHQLQIKKIGFTFIGLFIVLINVEGVQRLLLDEFHDYLYLRSNLPFTIPHFPQYILVPLLAILSILLIYLLDFLYLKLTIKKSHLF